LQGKRDKFMQDLIEEHRRRRSDRDPAFEERGKTMINVLLSLQEAEPEYYTDEIIRGMTLVSFLIPSEKSMM
jgi:cytochrome P450